MNYLAIDFGTKRIGMAYSINNIIFTLPMVENNNKFLEKLNQIVSEYKIEKIYVGMSQGKMAQITQKFVSYLSSMIKLPIETVEEAVSTIEADKLFLQNKKNNKTYHKKIDSMAAAIILNRVIN